MGCLPAGQPAGATEGCQQGWGRATAGPGGGSCHRIGSPGDVGSGHARLQAAGHRRTPTWLQLIHFVNGGQRGACSMHKVRLSRRL